LRRSFLAVVVAWAALLAAVAAGQSRPQTTIGVDEIQPGMRGYGLTVFRGTQPERFDVEVIGVLHNFRPDMDLILIRTDHPILDHASTVAGMSGSPIYLDGRLAGAYSYGWSFGKDPVAGVTPIASMLAEMGRPVRPDSFPGADQLPPIRPPRVTRPEARSGPRAHRRGAPNRRLAGLSPYLASTRRTPVDVLRDHVARFGDASRAGPQGMLRAATPLMLAGFTDTSAAALGEQLEPYGLLALQAGGGERSSGTPPAFVDGGAIGVQLVRGDVSATAIGTVTHVGPRRTIAFGHPMLNAGEVGLPTSTARVLHILASESRSFKIGEADTPLGTLIHDRQPTIVVDNQLEAETIPVTVRVRGVDGAPRTEWNMEVASHRVLSPLLTLSAISNALEATASDQTDVMFTATGRVTLADHGEITVVDRGYSGAGASDARALSQLRIFELMEVAYGNPFEETRIRRVELDLDLRFARDAVQIVDASVASHEVDPGRPVNVHVVLRRYGRRDETRIIQVPIPTSASGQEIEVKLEAGDDVDLEEPIPRSVSDLVQIVRSRLPATELVASLKMPSRGLRFEGHVVHHLPGSALDSLQLANDTEGGAPFVTQVRRRLEVGEVLYGSATLQLQVREAPRNR
jgi:hypothetical protein